MLPRILVILALLAPAAAAQAGTAAPVTVPAAATLTLVARVPAGTPPDATLVLGTSLLGWDLSDPRARFARRPDGSFELTLAAVPVGTVLSFKVTRGSWETVEKDAAGAEIADRRLEVRGPATLDLRVARWADAPVAPRPRGTVTGTVETLWAVASRELGSSRDVLVYLPPSYGASPARRYPVLYLQDGQNVFDAATSFAGREWRADETAEALAGRGLEAILVAVPHGRAERMNEYDPFDPKGTLYSGFLARTLKPLVDARYRTRPEPAHTGLVGSALGGLISLHAAVSHPRVFGFVAALSPSLQGANGRFLEWARSRPAVGLRVYLDAGTRDAPLAADAATVLGRLRALAVALGPRPETVRLLVAEGATADEDAWAARFPAALEWFLTGR